MFKSLKSKYVNNIFIEFGSSVCKIYAPSLDVYISDLSLIATDPDYTIIHAIGADALKKNASPKMRLISPIENGAIHDYRAAELYLSHYLKDLSSKATLPTKFLGFNAYVSVHSETSEVALSALSDALLANNVLTVRYINEGAAMLYSLKDEWYDTGLICKIGADVTDIMVVISDEIIVDSTYDFGSKSINRAVRLMLEEKYTVSVSERFVDQLLQNLPLSRKTKGNQGKVEVVGKSMSSGQPARLSASSEELSSVVRDQIAQVTNSCLKLIKELPTEQLDAVVESGIFFGGGVTRMDGVQSLITKTFELPVRFCDPEKATLFGMEYFSKNPKLLESYEVKDFIFL